MAAELQCMEAPTAQNPNPRKRKPKHGKGKKKPNKKLKPVAKSKNPSQKMKKIFKKRARDYNSEDDEEEESESESEEEPLSDDDGGEEGRWDFDAEREIGGSDDDGDGAHLRITKFAEGCRAFKVAFLKIMKKKLPKDPLGPILSAQKKLVAEKLAEEETEHRAKGEAKKEKHLAGEKGHVKPASFLDAKEKSLISLATKGVVKLFNAVNKAQNPQRGLNPSKAKDAKELAKRRKRTFLSELKKSTSEVPDDPSPSTSFKVNKSVNAEIDSEPGWAPLRDSYMLTNPNLKDWDKMPEPSAVVDQGNVPLVSSSDED